MGKPESAVRKFRFILFALGLASGVLYGCAAESECDGADCEASIVASQAAVVNNNPVIEDINHVIVVTGQSNVEASDTDNGFVADLDQPHPRVFAFTENGWQIADLHQVWDSTSVNLWPDKIPQRYQR